MDGQQQQQQQTDSAASLIASGLADRSQAGSENTANPPQNQQQNQAEKKAAADQSQQQQQPNHADEIASLRKEIDALKASPRALEEQRRDYDAREDFINEVTGQSAVPRELLRAMIPPTRDKAALHAAAGKLEGMLGQFVKNQVARGVLRYVNIGGDSGGKSILEHMESIGPSPVQGTSPTDLISQGLSQARRPSQLR